MRLRGSAVWKPKVAPRFSAFVTKPAPARRSGAESFWPRGPGCGIRTRILDLFSKVCNWLVAVVLVGVYYASVLLIPANTPPVVIIPVRARFEAWRHLCLKELNT